MNPAAMFGSDVEPDAVVIDPLDLLEHWLARVGSADGAGTDFTTTPLMALATIDAAGLPRVRHVLLSAYDRGRLHFHTDGRTAKAAQLAADDRAGVTIVWPDIARQLSVSGHVVAETAAEQARAFARRTRYLQLLAWVNDETLARADATARQVAWEQFDAQHPELEPPPTWTGYVLVPEIITFWRGAAIGPSQRTLCRRRDGEWAVERLPG